MEATSTDVRKNKDGSYTVMGAYNDGDTNIYVVEKEISAKIIATIK